MIDVSQLTLMEQVALTNNTFNKPPLSQTDQGYWKALVQQGYLVEEEFSELVEGLGKSDLVEIRDAIADILVVTLGVAHLAGFKVQAQPVAPLSTKSGSLAGLEPLMHELTKDLKFQVNLMNRALDHKSIYAARDATQTVINLTLKIGAALNIDIAKDMIEVTLSNLSKVCPTLEDAVNTQHFYFDKKGVFTKLLKCPTIPGFVVLVEGLQTGKDGQVYPHKKFLKSIGFFKKPEFK